MAKKNNATKIRYAEADLGIQWTYISAEDAQADVEQWVNRKSWTNRFKVVRPRVVYPVKGWASEHRNWTDHYSDENLDALLIARGCLNDLTLRHELCHAVTGTRMADIHGHAFASNLLLLVKVVNGAHAHQKMKALFDEYEVDYEVLK